MRAKKKENVRGSVSTALYPTTLAECRARVLKFVKRRASLKKHTGTNERGDWALRRERKKERTRVIKRKTRGLFEHRQQLSSRVRLYALGLLGRKVKNSQARTGHQRGRVWVDAG